MSQPPHTDRHERHAPAGPPVFAPQAQTAQTPPVAPPGAAYAAPPYGQPHQGQPPYGQPHQGQPPYGQPHQGQPYGYPAQPLPYGQPYAPLPPRAPSRAFVVWAHILTWAPVGIVALCVLGIVIANLDGWSGDGIPSPATALGLLGMFVLVMMSPFLLGSLIAGLIMLVKSRR